jgi:hypothetical protein
VSVAATITLPAMALRMEVAQLRFIYLTSASQLLLPMSKSTLVICALTFRKGEAHLRLRQVGRYTQLRCGVGETALFVLALATSEHCAQLRFIQLRSDHVIEPFIVYAGKAITNWRFSFNWP